MGTSERDEIGASAGDERIDLFVLGNISHGHRCDADLVANCIGEGRLKHPPETRRTVRIGLSGRHIDEIGTGIPERARNLERVALVVTAFAPVRRRDTDRDRPLAGPPVPHCGEDLEREAQPIFERSSVAVAPPIP